MTTPTTQAAPALRAIDRGAAFLTLAALAFEEAAALLDALLPELRDTVAERRAIVRRNAVYAAISAFDHRDVLAQVCCDYTDAARGIAANADMFRTELAEAGYDVILISGVEELAFPGQAPAVALDDERQLAEIARVTRAEIGWRWSGELLIVFAEPNP
ncbi:MAG TPA: hypothetical protein VNL77_16685 [Roseiflexaceae bacterium]|nr:hypothetical protein [Roseiflexaceae bacterium]